jgi:quercetin dioxygenase-like cupin family protein
MEAMATMQTRSVDITASEQLEMARQSPAARSSITVVGGHSHALRQTVIALAEDAEMSEHHNLGESTLYVLSGRVEVRQGDQLWHGAAGDLLELPHSRHSVHALEDATMLLTAVPHGFVVS